MSVKMINLVEELSSVLNLQCTFITIVEAWKETLVLKVLLTVREFDFNLRG